MIDREVSSPTRSRSASGPIGKLQPPFIASSMSPADATPDSSRRTALLRYGNSNAFTMKPAWSFTTTGFLPHASAKKRTSAMVSSEAVSGRTISTSAISGAGLKKWTPQTFSGRPVCTASSTTGNVEVFVARIVWSSQTLSSSLKSAFLTSRSSTTDSITRSQPASSPMCEVPRTREIVSARSPSESLPRSTCLTSDFSSAATIARAVSCLRDRTTTSWPDRAAHSAMPAPMMPEPTIPTRLIVMVSRLGLRPRDRPPRLSAMTGVLALVGGGEWQDGCDFDRELLTAAGGAEVLVLPTAAAYEHPGRLVERAVAWFEGLGGRARGLMVLSRPDAEDEANVEAVQASPFTYLAGTS